MLIDAARMSSYCSGTGSRAGRRSPARRSLPGPITEGPDGDQFHADIAEVVHTRLNDEATMLLVEWWTPTHGLRKIERE